MKFFVLIAAALTVLPAQASSNKARMCNAIYADIEHVAQQYQQAVRLGSSSAYALKRKGERMLNNVPYECR